MISNNDTQPAVVDALVRQTIAEVNRRRLQSNVQDLVMGRPPSLNVPIGHLTQAQIGEAADILRNHPAVPMQVQVQINPPVGQRGHRAGDYPRLLISW